jgi:serine/threonine protein phosphatase 1
VLEGTVEDHVAPKKMGQTAKRLYPRRVKRDPVIAVGDIHGCASELLALVERLTLTPETTLVFVGDYIDRGPHSRQVIDVVLGLRERCRVVTLLGNHEEMLLDFLFNRSVETAGLFVFNGGGTTLASYADDSGDYAIPRDHIDFFKDLAPVHETSDHFFVHAGVPEVPLDAIDPESHRIDLLWSRAWFNSSYAWSKVIVHGHTDVNEVESLPHRINVDTGCVYDNALSAVELPSRRVIGVRRQERVRAAVLRNKASRRRAVRFKGALTVHVQRGQEELTFETLDYSPIGIFIRLISTWRRPPRAREVIQGTIGRGKPGAVRFKGVVVRELANQEGLFYGVEIRHSEEIGHGEENEHGEESGHGEENEHGEEIG